MALTITHAKVSTAGPSADPDKVGGDDWNDDHVLIGDYLRKAIVTLSSADILALNSSPKTLVAAPGAGKALMVHRVIAFLDGQTTPYTMTDNVIVQYQGASSALCGTLNGLLAETGDKFGTYAASDFLYTTAWAENTLVELFAIDGNPTLGDGTLTVTVWYSIEDVPA